MLLDATGEKDIDLGRELAAKGRGLCRVIHGYRDVAPAVSDSWLPPALLPGRASLYANAQATLPPVRSATFAQRANRSLMGESSARCRI